MYQTLNVGKTVLNTGPSYYPKVAKWAQGWYNLEILCHFATPLLWVTRCNRPDYTPCPEYTRV